MGERSVMYKVKPLEFKLSPIDGMYEAYGIDDLCFSYTVEGEDPDCLTIDACVTQDIGDGDVSACLESTYFYSSVDEVVLHLSYFHELYMLGRYLVPTETRGLYKVKPLSWYDNGNVLIGQGVDAYSYTYKKEEEEVKLLIRCPPCFDTERSYTFEGQLAEQQAKHAANNHYEQCLAKYLEEV